MSVRLSAVSALRLVIKLNGPDCVRYGGLVIWLMFSCDCKPWPKPPKSFACAVESVHLRAFDIHFDEIDSQQR